MRPRKTLSVPNAVLASALVLVIAVPGAQASKTSVNYRTGSAETVTPAAATTGGAPPRAADRAWARR